MEPKVVVGGDRRFESTCTPTPDGIPYFDGPGDGVLVSGCTSIVMTYSSAALVDVPMPTRGGDGRVETDCLPSVVQCEYVPGPIASLVSERTRLRSGKPNV